MKATDLEKARVAAKEARYKIRATKDELNQAADIVFGKPFLLRTKEELVIINELSKFKRSQIESGWH